MSCEPVGVSLKFIRAASTSTPNPVDSLTRRALSSTNTVTSSISACRRIMISSTRWAPLAASCSCGCRPSAQTRRRHLQLHGRKAPRSLAKSSGAPPAGSRRAQCVPARFDPSCVQTLIVFRVLYYFLGQIDETLILMHSLVVHLAVTLTVLPWYIFNRTIRRHARRAR